MKALTNILTRLLMLLLLMLVACTEDAAEVDDLVRGEQYVQVRMQVPGMKAAATRAEDGVIESITALVYRGGVLKKIETAIELTTTNFKMPKPLKDDVIHFLANLPDDYSLPEIGTNESALCALTTDHQTLCYWGKYTYNDEAVINTLTLYRNMAKIEIVAGDECTFPEDELFIAGLVNANQAGALVPYDNVKKAFNFNLGDNDYYTLPASPSPKTDGTEQTLVTSLYVLEHDNPDTYTEANKDKFFYVICKIGKDYYYKVALTSDGKTPYDIIRNHKYTIYVHDLDEGARTYPDALTAKPINLKVIETTDLQFSYTDNSTVYLNGGKNATLPVQITVPQDASLTEFNITTTNFTVTSSNGGTLTETQSGYSYAGGSTTFTFTPNSGLAAGTYTIKLSGSGNYLHAFTETITVTVDATMMAVTTANDSDATLDMDDGDTGVTLVLTQPGNVDNVEVSVSADVFNVANTDNEYTFTPKDNNIAAGDYTVTFADSNYPNVNKTATITVVNTPKVRFTNTGSPIQMNGTPLTVTMNVPEGKSLSEFEIKVSPATGLDVAQNGTALTLTEGVYTTTLGVSGPNTFTFTPTATGEYTITFSGSGEGVNMPQETINLTVNAAAVTTMSATSGTIDMDNSETFTTITLTKPTNVQNIKVTFDANTFIINDNQYHTSNDYWINNNSNSTIDIKFTIRNNNVAAGTYNVTFTDNGQMSATATITVVNTPKVTFTNTSDKTLYWNNSSPTNFQVQMTGVPDGKSVTLSITGATAFTITDANSNELQLDGDNYTYTGGNTTFTIKPKDANSVRDDAYTIGFSGTGDGVNVVPAEVSVKVEATKPAVTETPIWVGSITFVQWGDNKCYVEDKAILSNIVAGVKLNLYLTADGADTNVQLFYEWDNPKIYDGNIQNGIVTIDVDETIANNINNNRIIVQGNNCTLTKITVSSQ